MGMGVGRQGSRGGRCCYWKHLWTATIHTRVHTILSPPPSPSQEQTGVGKRREEPASPSVFPFVFSLRLRGSLSTPHGLQGHGLDCLGKCRHRKAQKGTLSFIQGTQTPSSLSPLLTTGVPPSNSHCPPPSNSSTHGLSAECTQGQPKRGCKLKDTPVFQGALSGHAWGGEGAGYKH